MITAKNLLLLDTQGNNISPAVNIETLYYEQTDGNIVKRNHIFKHFPVYVKYNGKPDTAYIDTIGSNFYDTTITPYNNIQWPILADVSKQQEFQDYPDLCISDNVELKIKQTNNSYDDILISSVRQVPLGNGTDFMKLDISTYNLTTILQPLAYKDWVNLRLDHYDTKLKNNNIYVSERINPNENTNDIDEKRTLYTTLKSVGLLKKGTNIKTELNGLTYTELFDKIFFGPVEPTISPCVIDLSIGNKFYVTDTTLSLYHSIVLNLNSISYLYNKIKNAVTVSTEFAINEDNISVPCISSFNMNGEYLEDNSNLDLIASFQFNTTSPALSGNVYKFKSNSEKYKQNTANTDDNDTTEIVYNKNEYTKPVNVTFSFPYSLWELRNYTHLPIRLSFNYNTNFNNIRNSVGEKIFSDDTFINAIIDKFKPKYTLKVNGEILKNDIWPKTESNNDTMGIIANSDENVKWVNKIELNYPIKFGHTLSKLKTKYVTALKFNKIDANWDPSKPFYICVPRILTGQLINPIPSLHRILQQSRWLETTQWPITSVSSSDVLAAYNIYTVAPVGLGNTRKILFSIDLSVPNLLANRDNMIRKNSKTEK